MDFSKFKTSDWLKVGGGGVFLIASFLGWWGLDDSECGGVRECERLVDANKANGWDYFFTGIVPTLLLVAIAVLTVLAIAGKLKMPANLPMPLVFLAASGLSVLLVLLRFFSDGIDNDAFFGEVETKRGIGLFLALLAAIVVLVGCVLGFKESGGDLNDLTDMDKLKGAFNQGGGSTPPPPPGMTPPPPPPPPGGMTPPPPPPPPA
jgi:hypothetical protein